jgi:uncharacterized protein (TIRG00374 family)
MATTLRAFAALVGALLMVYLMVKAGPSRLLQNSRAIGWGMILVLALAGISHCIKTWAWRLTLLDQAKKVSFSHTLGLRLVSEAIGQLGFIGLIFGESTRVALLGSGVPIASGISSVALDRGLFIASGAVVTLAGILASTIAVATLGMQRLFAGLFVFALLCLLALILLTVRNGWPLFSGIASAAGHIPRFRKWLDSRMAVIESVDRQLLEFHRHAPAAFWTSLLLNFVCHFLAIAEVYLILLLLGTRVSFLGALILESLTKLINVIGAINPGNLGTYEGGNIAIGRLLGFSATEGLTLGLCRRFRSVFWAIVGGLCFACLSKSNQHALTSDKVKPGTEAEI